jgi:hypothetical protein
MTAPKLFISYSWSDAEHEKWVINLATELRESGVDAILDKWGQVHAEASSLFRKNDSLYE